MPDQTRITSSSGRGKPRPCRICDYQPGANRRAIRAYVMARVVERWAPA